MADDDTEALIDEWGADNVQAAFWLQRKIKREGIDGIGYMEAARNHLRVKGEGKLQSRKGSSETAGNINDQGEHNKASIA